MSCRVERQEVQIPPRFLITAMAFASCPTIAGLVIQIGGRVLGLGMPLALRFHPRPPWIGGGGGGFRGLRLQKLLQLTYSYLDE